MRLRLSQNVVEIISNGNENKTFFNKLRNAVGAEQKQTQNLSILSAIGNHLLRRFAEFFGEVHVGEGVLFKQSHAHAQVVLP